MSTAGSDVILSLRGLAKSYGDVVAVRGLSLDILRGEVFGFLGPNGAGKTTTINMICGLLECDAGEVIVDGISVAADHRRCKQMMGLCPQDLVIWESLTCLEQLEFFACQFDVKWHAAKRRALELLHALGLEEKKNKLAKTLSGGMKRRLNIALALVNSPRILILDEPQAGLDPQSRILVREYVRSLAASTTVILTTHDMDEADRLADRIAIIDHGELLVLDTSDGLKTQIGAGDVLEIRPAPNQGDKLDRLCENSPDSLRGLVFQHGTLRLVAVDILSRLPTVLDELRSLEVQVSDIFIRKKTLEDVFIALTGRRLRE